MGPNKETEKERRKTGIDILGDVPWGTHVCQFYQTKKDLINILVPYFKAGLESNEFCMWIVSEPLGTKEAEEALAKSVSDLENYIKSGQMEIISHSEWYLKVGTFDPQRVIKGLIDKLNKALENGYAGFRISGNTTWLEKKLWSQFVDYEKDVNEIIREYRMIAVCSYALDNLGVFEVVQASNNHQFALIKRGGKWELIKDGERKKAEKRFLDEQAHLKFLASELSLAEEAGKHHIALRVHDEICQSLAISKVKLEALRKSASSEEFRMRLDEVCRELGESILELNSLIIDINSPVLHESGFEAGVAELITEYVKKKQGIDYQFEDDGQEKLLSHEAKVLMFRNVRELLIDVFKHAHAHIVKVTIRKVGSQMQVTVKDDGVGFDVSKAAQRKAGKKGYGHYVIKQRLEVLRGHLEIESKPGHGCSVTMKIPLKS